MKIKKFFDGIIAISIAMILLIAIMIKMFLTFDIGTKLVIVCCMVFLAVLKKFMQE